MWRHFFDQETSAEGLAEAMLSFQRRYDWDFMKVNPRASYHAEDWGLRMQRTPGGVPMPASTPIKEPEDWLKLEVLDVYSGTLGEQLRALEMVAQGLDGQVPFLETVFTPLSIASRLAPSEAVFLRHLREHWESVRHALEVVTETFTKFSKACLNRGADGLFYATTSWATTQSMTVEEYDRFAKPYDLRLLDSLPSVGFHILHICGQSNMVAHLKDYPVHAFNWDTLGKGNLSLAEGKALLGQPTVIGGLAHSALPDTQPEQVECGAKGIVAAMGNKGWMLGPGCTFPPQTSDAVVCAVRRAVDGT
jgi:uroporphyrinogen decarboxylase